jgi:predicted metal-binding membrane protein
MWVIMMVGMMVPSAAPVILLHALMERKQRPAASPCARTAFFTTGYLAAWAGFSVIATAAQWGLSEATLLSPAMVGTSPVLGGALFAAAGVYQLTPLKSACLRHCRAPMSFLMRRYRAGNFGVLRMGLEHGAFCVGCCWFLMVLLFTLGVMNLLWVAAITVFVLLEKVLPATWPVTPISSGLMIGAGALLLAVQG